MQRKTLLASALAVLIAGSTSFVMAQNTPPPPSPTQSAMAVPMRQSISTAPVR